MPDGPERGARKEIQEEPSGSVEGFSARPREGLSGDHAAELSSSGPASLGAPASPDSATARAFLHSG